MSGAVGAHRSTVADLPGAGQPAPRSPAGVEQVPPAAPAAPTGAGNGSADGDGAVPPVDAALPAPPLVAVALKGLCPRCGQKTLFGSLLGFADRCSACGLDLSRFNVGDGPAAFLTLILGAIVVALAVWLELAVGPPLWVHMLVWIPFTAIGVIGSLRIAKAALLTAEYRNAAREGRIDGTPPA